MPKTIALVPVYNEEKTLAGVLQRISKQVDLLICVNDGSKDASLSIIKKFMARRKNAYVVDLPFNTGMAGAIKNGFLFVLYLQGIGVVDGNDVVVTIDADGQHKPEYIRGLVKFLRSGKFDVVLTRRDFSVYPLYKIWGNRFLTLTNSIFSGFHYKDVESGLRALKVKTLASILEFYTGLKYSCAQEIALISARAGYKISNDFVVEIAYYRPGTTIWDGFIVLFLSFLTCCRWIFGLGSRPKGSVALFEKAYSSSRKIWDSSSRRDKK